MNSISLQAEKTLKHKFNYLQAKKAQETYF